MDCGRRCLPREPHRCQLDQQQPILFHFLRTVVDIVAEFCQLLLNLPRKDQGWDHIRLAYSGLPAVYVDLVDQKKVAILSNRKDLKT